MTNRLGFAFSTAVCAASLVGYLWWITVTSLPGTNGALIVSAIAAVLVLLTVRKRVHADLSADAIERATQQLKRIGILILAAATTHIVVAAMLILFENQNPAWDMVLSFIVWVGAPAVGLSTGWIARPHPVSFPSRRDRTVVAFVAMTIAIAVALFSARLGIDQIGSVWTGFHTTRAIAMLFAAIAEELVFRVLLLTAIFAVTRSVVQSLVITSTIFVAVHVLVFAGPAALLADPIWLSDTLTYALQSVLYQFIVGVICGALWLRTSSFVLIVAVHYILNIGSMVGTAGA